MNWLPRATDFKDRLSAARDIVDLRDRIAALSRLALAQLSFVEERQLDKALVEATDASAPSSWGLLPLRIAVLSTSTVDHLLPSIRVACLRRGILAELYAGGFGQYRQEVLDPTSPLVAFRPDFVALSLSAREVLASIPIGAPAAAVDQALATQIEELRGLWRFAREHLNVTVIQQTFLDISLPVFGSLDSQVSASPHRLISRLNDRLSEATATDGALLLDVTSAAGRDGLDAWFDVRHWLHGKMEIAPAAANRFGELLSRVLAAQRGKSRKCLVLDLDNTLWGGVIGDDGIEGIVIGEGSARGEAHLALQRYARVLKDRGIILAACSKNDPDIAESVFRCHPEMALQRSDFASFIANWDDKAANLPRIAAQLNIGLDSLVFVDDNPVERARIRGALPAVAVPELPADPAEYVRCLAEAGYFEAVTFTVEDLQRTEQYVANAERDSLRDASASIEQFLRSLQMSMRAGRVSPVDAERAVQLINKTNQFNTTTRRVSREEFERFAADPRNRALQFRLTDRFGDNGLVSVMLLAAHEERAWRIENWVMSCRVFGRQLEEEALNVAVEAAAGCGVQRLLAEFIPTAKNKVVSDLYERLGFARSEREPDGRSMWELPVAEYLPRSTAITRASDGN